MNAIQFECGDIETRFAYDVSLITNIFKKSLQLLRINEITKTKPYGSVRIVTITIIFNIYYTATHK